ncbi:MAG: hypothetical protein ABIM19_09325 [candidate division WOR-3 bacterium]
MNLLTFFFFVGALPKVVIEDAEPYVEHVPHAPVLGPTGIESKYDRIYLRVLFVNESHEVIKVPGSHLPDFRFNKGEGVIELYCGQEDYRRFWLTIRNPDGDTMQYMGVIEECFIGGPLKPICPFYQLHPAETLIYFVELSDSYSFLEPGTYRIEKVWYQVEEGPPISGSYYTDSFQIEVNYTFQIKLPEKPIPLNEDEFTKATRSMIKKKGYEPGLGPMLSILDRIKGTNSERIIACEIIASIKEYPQDRKLFIGLILDQMRRFPEYFMLTKPFPDSLNGKPFPDYLGKEGIALFDSLMTHNTVFREAWTMHELFKAWSREWDEKHKGGQ